MKNVLLNQAASLKNLYEKLEKWLELKISLVRFSTD
jgi:hypothetical protein